MSKTIRIVRGIALAATATFALGAGTASAQDQAAEFLTDAEAILATRGPLHLKQLQLSVALQRVPLDQVQAAVERASAELMPKASHQRLEWLLRTEVPAIRDLGRLPLETVATPDGLGGGQALAPAQVGQLARNLRKVANRSLEAHLENVVAAALSEADFDRVSVASAAVRVRTLNSGEQAFALVGETAVAAGLQITAEARQKAAQRLIEAAEAWRGDIAALTIKDREFAEAVQRHQRDFTEGLALVGDRITQANAAYEQISGAMAAANQTDDLVGYVSAFRQSIKVLDEAGADVSFMKAAVVGTLTGDDILKGFERYEGRKESYRTIAESRTLLVAEVQDYIGDVQAFATVLSKVGVLSGPDAENVAKGLQIATTAANVISSVASGNVVGAVMAVTGVLGGGTRDMAAERHGEVIANQQRILAGIGHLMQGQQKILEGIGEILDAQRRTMEMILELSEQVQRNQEELLRRLDRLEFRQVALAVAVQWLNGKDIGRCRELGSLGNYTDYDAMRVEFWQRREDFAACRDGIADHLFSLRVPEDHADSAASIGPYFLMRYHPGEGKQGLKELLAYEERIGGAFGTFEKALPDVEERARIAARLMTPSLTVEDLKERIDGEMPRRTLLKYFRDPLNHSAVLDATLAALLAHPLYELRDSNGALLDSNAGIAAFSGRGDYSPRQVEPDKGFSSYDGLRALEKADALLDLAIAQQALLSGDAFLFTVDRTRNSPGMRRVLRENPVMARNYALFVVKRGGLRASGGAYVPSGARWVGGSLMSGIAPGYDFVHSPEGDAIDKQICAKDLAQEANAADPGQAPAPQQADFGQIPKGWSLRIAPCLHAPLPTPEDFASGRLEQTAILQRLLVEKKKIAQARASYEFARAGTSGKPFVPDELFRYGALRVMN